MNRLRASRRAPAPDPRAASPADATSALVELSVVIPVFNERPRLRDTLDAVCRHLRRSTRGWEVIVCDDGSSDGSAAVVAAYDDDRVRLLRSPVNRGKGHAVRHGVEHTRGRLVLCCDADLATPIEELDRLLEALSRGASAAIGSRSLPDARIEAPQPAARVVLGRWGNRVIRALAVPGVRDTQCGFKLFDGELAREVFARTRSRGWGFDVEVLHLFLRKGFKVTEVPVRWSHRPGSSVRWHHYPRTLAEVVGMRLRHIEWAGWRAHLRYPAIYLAIAFVLYAGLWIDPNDRYLVDSGQDQNQWEWFFSVTAHAVAHLDNPLFTSLENFPSGVNLMANTTMLGVSVPLTPVTLLCGPGVSWAVVLTGSLAGTGAAWYALLYRRLSCSRAAAGLGGGAVAFAPAVISHANAHPNFVALFVVPFIVSRLMALWARQRPVRNGVILGLLVTYQLFIGEEVLLLTALGMLIFAAAYAGFRPRAALAALRPLAIGIGAAAGVAAVVAGFPLWWQFFGPQSYHGLLHGDSGNDAASFTAFATRSLAGHREVAEALSSPTEQNAFFGWPVVIATVGAAIALWRLAIVRSLAVVIAVAAVLSLGSGIYVNGTEIGIPAPWRLAARLPLLDSIVESRLALICVPAIAVLFALALTRMHSQLEPPWQKVPRLLWIAALAAVLLPAAPTPLWTQEREATPAFFTQGIWREYAPEGGVIVPVPVPDTGATEAMHWQTRAGMGFRIPEGYFIGPGGPDRRGSYGAQPRPTGELLRDVADGGDAPELTAAQKRRARQDLRYWRADAVVLAPQWHDGALRATVTQLLGEPRFVGGIWVWRV